MKNYDYENSALNEPFKVGRDESRLLFDVGIAFSCLNMDLMDNKILDFASGTGWISEWLNRMGWDVVACDIFQNFAEIGNKRFSLDMRINLNNINFVLSDGEKLSFKSEVFSNIICFDSLHHMTNYSNTINEFYRVLAKGGRAIFVEPGAKHSTSIETIEFLNKYKEQLAPNWIERDVILETIYKISECAGFKDMILKPFLFPNMSNYSINEWLRFREGDEKIIDPYLDQLKNFNYDSRVCFYLEK